MAWSPGYLGDVGGPDDGAGSEQRDERGRGRSRAAGGTSGGRRSRSADPAATIGQALPGLPVFLFGLIAHGQPHAPTSVRWPCRV